MNTSFITHLLQDCEKWEVAIWFSMCHDKATLVVHVARLGRETSQLRCVINPQIHKSWRNVKGIIILRKKDWVLNFDLFTEALPDLG